MNTETQDYIFDAVGMMLDRILAEQKKTVLS